MKPIYSYLLIIFLAAGLILSLLHKPAPENSKLEQAIKERDESINRVDSIMLHVEKIRDSLETAFLLLENSKKDVERAHAETRKAIKRYENIVFTRFDTDSARVRMLSKLYHSYPIH
jgi:hypothetical protein